MVEKAAPEQEQEETLATPGVIDKYKDAGKIANLILQKVIAKCVPKASIVDICHFGDSEIEKEVQKVHNKKKIEKGLGFPTCISVNEICGHYSPLISEPTNLNEGDIAKIDLGVHIDGYIALVSHTIVVSEAPAKVVLEGPKANAFLAAWNCIQAAYRLMKPGNTNTQVTEAMKKICESYGVSPLEGVLSHEVKKHLIDGNNCVILNSTFDQRVDEHEFQINEVYAMDVLVSTGEGKPKESDYRTTVFKRELEKAYILKTKSARAFYNEINLKYPSLCFSMRALEDEITAKLGVKECIEHDLLNGYQVLVEKPGDFVVHFKFTIMILQGGTQQITGLPLNVEQFKSDKKIEDQTLVDLLAQSMEKQAQKQAKKKNKKKSDKKDGEKDETKKEAEQKK